MSSLTVKSCLEHRHNVLDLHPGMQLTEPIFKRKVAFRRNDVFATEDWARNQPLLGIELH